MQHCTLIVFIMIMTCSCGRDTYGDDAGTMDATDATSLDAQDGSSSRDIQDASQQDMADTSSDAHDATNDSDCAISQCAIEDTPDFFDPATCTPFNCGDILAVCIENGEDSEFELTASLSSVGKFECNVSNTRCIAANTDCSNGICCVLDKTAIGTFESTFYPEICEASDLIRGVGCIFLP